jgi:hypothetical protein
MESWHAWPHWNPDGHGCDHGRIALAAPGARHLRNDIEARLIGIRACVAEAGNVAVNDVFIQCLDIVIPETELFHRPGGHIG